MGARNPAAPAASDAVSATDADHGVELAFSTCYWPKGPSFVRDEDGKPVEHAPEGESQERRIREGSIAFLLADEAMDVIEGGHAKRVRR